jgi:hypothetical protein
MGAGPCQDDSTHTALLMQVVERLLKFAEHVPGQRIATARAVDHNRAGWPVDANIHVAELCRRIRD